MFRERVPENCERSADYPVNARSIWSLSKRLGSGWALGGHPETSAHPDAEWRSFREAGPLWARDGLVGAKTQFPWGTGPAGDAAAFPELYSGLAAEGLTLCRGSQVFQRRVDSHSQPANRCPMRKRQKSPCFSSNRSTMESMIGSGKIRMVDPAVASQSGRATE